MSTYDGDLRVRITEEGANVTFTGGEPERTQDLETAILLSLHGGYGWVGNLLFDDPNERMESRYERAKNQPITITALNEIRDAAEADLNWMVEAKLITDLDITVYNPASTQIRTEIRAKDIHGRPLEVVTQ